MEATFNQGLSDQLDVCEKSVAYGQLLESLELLLKLLTNIGMNPIEPKYRKIKTSNATIKAKLFRLENASSIIKSIGFDQIREEDNSISYELKDSQLSKMLGSINQLKSRIDLINARSISLEEYERVKALQQQTGNAQKRALEQKQKLSNQLNNQIESDKQERKYIEVKDSIAVNMNQKRQQSPIQYISGDGDFNMKVLQNEKPVILDFYADWCPPCKKLSELIETELSESKGWVVAKVNCDDSNNAGIKSKHGVSGIPAVFFYYKGQMLKEYSFTGFNAAALQKAIQHAVTLSKK